LAKYSSYSIKVFYTLGANSNLLINNGFGKEEHWNIDLLSGYNYEFIENVSSRPSSSTYWGIKNPLLINKILSYQPDVLIVYGWKHQSHLSVLNYFHNRVPILFRGDSTTLNDSSAFFLRPFFRYVFLQWVYRKVDYVLSPGKASDKYFLRSGLRKNQIIRAEHAIDNERFMSMTEKEEEQLLNLKISLSIKPSEIVFLFAGKFIEVKSPFLLINAFVNLKKQNSNVRLLFVGNGILENEIIKKLNEFPVDISSSITLLSFQDQVQMKLLYRVADVFVLPSKSETWGLSVNEALACGTPVLVSDKCGSSIDLIKEDLNGLVFKSEDSQNLLQQMQKMCNNDFRKQLAANTRISLKKYTYQSYKNALDQLFEISEN
jgi:glycosyltransferase involved in cell wall biosynthesis